MKRCYQCDGQFGLIRHRFALKQFCSERCLVNYRAHKERRKAPSKHLTENTVVHVLARKSAFPTAGADAGPNV